MTTVNSFIIKLQGLCAFQVLFIETVFYDMIYTTCIVRHHSKKANMHNSPIHIGSKPVNMICSFSDHVCRMKCSVSRIDFNPPKICLELSEQCSEMMCRLYREIDSCCMQTCMAFKGRN